MCDECSIRARLGSSKAAAPQNPQNPFSSWPVVSDFDAQPSKNKGAMRAIKPLTEAL